MNVNVNRPSEAGLTTLRLGELDRHERCECLCECVKGVGVEGSATLCTSTNTWRTLWIPLLAT